MESLSASEARANLFGLVEQVNADHLPRQITSRKGDAVLLSRKDWESLQETLYLQSIPGFIQSVKAAEEENDWVSEDDFMSQFDASDNA
ncbi:MAG: type II toxin-antitoxin system Phd/YefM family antitoxin [Cyanobacteria bacterium J06627_28]